MVAEESTAWPLVTCPAEAGGLGFNLKWNMGWMNDMCHYLKLDPYFRQFNHRDITFSMMYAFSENYVLPLSHDEVVHMKGSLVGKMPGDYENQLRSLRGFYAYLLAHPGKKLLFMGPEIGQWHEWDANGQLDWYLLDAEINRRTQDFFRAANRFYQKTPELWEVDFQSQGFEWLVPDDNRNNMAVFLRRDAGGRDLLCAVNFSPNSYPDYRVGVPDHRRYTEVFNTDAEKFGGSGYGNLEPVEVEAIPSHGRDCSVSLRIPPFGGVFLRGEGKRPVKKDGTKSKTRAPKKAAKAAAERPEKPAKPSTASPAAKREKTKGKKAVKRPAAKPGK
jgi:1,4-alpha-glucan branching enzyme